MNSFNKRALKDYDEEHPLIASHWLDDDNGHGESHHTIKIYFDDKFCYFKIEKMEIYPYKTYWVTQSGGGFCGGFSPSPGYPGEAVHTSNGVVWSKGIIGSFFLTKSKKTSKIDLCKQICYNKFIFQIETY